MEGIKNNNIQKSFILKIENYNNKNNQNKSNPKVKEDNKIHILNPINVYDPKSLKQEVITNINNYMKDKNNNNILIINNNKSFNSCKTFDEVPKINLPKNLLNNNKNKCFKNLPKNIDNFNFNLNLNKYLNTRQFNKNRLNYKIKNANNSTISRSINDLFNYKMIHQNTKNNISRIKKKLIILNYSQKSRKNKKFVNASLLNDREQNKLKRHMNLNYIKFFPESTKNINRGINYDFFDNSLKSKYIISNLEFPIKFSTEINETDVSKSINGQLSSLCNSENSQFPTLVKKLNEARSQHQNNLKIIENLSKENEKLKKEYGDLQKNYALIGTNGKIIQFLEMKLKNTELKKKNKNLLEELKALETKLYQIKKTEKNENNNNKIRLNNREFLLGKIEKLENEFQELINKSKAK